MKKVTDTANEEATKEEKTGEKPPVKPLKKEETPVNTTRFIGFHRHSDGGPWTILSSMLSSAESIKHKIELFRGECEIHVVEVDLPQ